VDLLGGSGGRKYDGVFTPFCHGAVSPCDGGEEACAAALYSVGLLVEEEDLMGVCGSDAEAAAGLGASRIQHHG